MTLRDAFLRLRKNACTFPADRGEQIDGEAEEDGKKRKTMLMNDAILEKWAKGSGMFSL